MLIAFASVIWIYLTFDAGSENIITRIRLPRLVLTIMAGAILSTVGYVFQLMLNNPIADPYILGVSSGAALGSTLAAVMNMFILMPVLGFAGALISMLAVWTLANFQGFFNQTKLILSGIIISMFFSACISLIMYLHQDDAGNILQVLLGNLGHIFTDREWNYFLIFSAIAVVLMLYLNIIARKIHILACGDLIAENLGISIKKFRIEMFIICSLLTGFIVSYTGIIGFAGLIVPHIVRMLFGVNQRFSILWSGIAGAFLLTICDFFALHISVVPVPVGIVTAFIGTPFFMYIILKKDTR